MKLRNKKTGEIVEDAYVRETHDFQFDGQKHVLAVFKGNGHRPPERISGPYSSLAELNAEWEDYEPQKYWYIDPDGNIEKCSKDDEYDKPAKEIGNYFETKEEAEKAVEKLKAWKRLKDNGFKFDYGRDYQGDHAESVYGNIDFEIPRYDGVEADLDLLFGGEE